MARKLVMTFNDAAGEKCNVTVNAVKSDLSSTEVNALMDLIVTTKIFSSKNGLLSSKDSAKTVDTEETAITIS